MASALPVNLAPLTLGDIVRVTTARTSGSFDTRALGVVTDNRQSVAGSLFVALRGPRFDGHDFVARALDAGALLALVDEEYAQAQSDPRLAVVPDCYRALGQLARLHRERWGGKLVAVAGSAGKTTTRRAIARVLEQSFPGQVHSPPGNFNNQVGVPLVLLGLEAQHRVAVVEIGTNQPGEVAWLASLVQPDVAVLTLIGIEHSEGLGSLEQIASEEGALLGSLRAGGSAVVNLDDALILQQVRAHDVRRVVGVGSSREARHRLLSHEITPALRTRVELQRDGEVLRFHVGLLGAAGAMAAALATAVADVLRDSPITSAELERAFETFNAGSGRLTPHLLLDASLVLDDSYNSNPPSVRAGLEVALAVAKQRRAGLVIVLGEMRELGSYSASEHARVGELVAQSGARHLIAIGEQTRPLIDAASRAGLNGQLCATVQEATPALDRAVGAGDVVWIKASRGIGAERLVEYLLTRAGEAP